MRSTYSRTTKPMYLVLNSQGMGVVLLHLQTSKVFNIYGNSVGFQTNCRTSEYLRIDESMVLYRSKSKNKALNAAKMYSTLQ